MNRVWEIHRTERLYDRPLIIADIDGTKKCRWILLESPEAQDTFIEDGEACLWNHAPEYIPADYVKEDEFEGSIPELVDYLKMLSVIEMT